MAADTDRSLQNQVIYSVYVRAHTPEGTFRAVIDDLDRIRALGVDIIWLMPIHPIGVEGKKGSLGCPYANRDYRTVNPAYGTMSDFKALADAVHERGMKLIIDVVYHHTSPDSTLWQEHPEYFYQDEEGRPGNRIGDWSDVIDLDFGEPGLWEYLIDCLCLWAETVDGFRCDVASLVPLEFWKRARAAVEQVRPGCIWLAESVHRSFSLDVRAQGVEFAHDTELYEAFDIEYEYDIRETFDRFLQGKTPLSHYVDDLLFQEAVYPDGYNKLRFLENHDQPRIAHYIPEENDLLNYTAMVYFLKGTTLLYAGQEFADEHLPSLFEKETIDRNTGRDLSPLMSRLNEIKKRVLSPDDVFFGRADDDYDIAIFKRTNADAVKYGVFSLGSLRKELPIDAPEGTYANLIDGEKVEVRDGRITCDRKPIIFAVPVKAAQEEPNESSDSGFFPFPAFSAPWESVMQSGKSIIEQMFKNPFEKKE